MAHLSISDQNSYRNCLKYFDNAEYKKGLKLSDQLHQKYPDHGDIESTKGLFLVYLNRPDEGLVSIKSGLKKNLSSSTSWHIYGIYYKVTKNFDEACKCYLNAAKFDPNNMNIRRDLCNLLAYIRRYPLLLEQLKSLNANQPTKATWLQQSLVHYLVGDFHLALDIVNKYESTVPVFDRDYSNLLLYKSKLYLKCSFYQKGITYLNKMEKHCLDPIGLLQIRAQLFLKSCKFDRSLFYYKELLKFNPEDFNHVKGYLCCKLKVEEYSESLPMSSALCELNKEFNSYCIRFKWIDSLNEELKLKETILFMKKVVNKSSPGFWRLFKHVHDANPELYNAAIQQLIINTPPSTIAYYYITYSRLAQSMDLNDLESAAKHLNDISEMQEMSFVSKTDKIDFIVAKSKLLKKNNKYLEAANVLVDALNLDKGDRALNVRYCKYMIRAKNLNKALVSVQSFLRTEPKEELIVDLLNVQCFWLAYELLKYFESTTVFFKLSKLVLGYFGDIKQDELDFQGFCIRKSVFDPYIDHTNWMNNGMEHRLVFKILMYLGDSIARFEENPNIPLDDADLQIIFGKSDKDLQGGELFKSFDMKKGLLQIAGILSKMENILAKEKAFYIYYQQSNHSLI
eukprot:NODE_312_length_11237_cov_0.283624.p2 type:complete len:625 gc:universal NODE_312_length_11237_cov_0.283624:178-2052(+)